jgi:hypothetical protein
MKSALHTVTVSVDEAPGMSASEVCRYSRRYCERYENDMRLIRCYLRFDQLDAIGRLKLNKIHNVHFRRVTADSTVITNVHLTSVCRLVSRSNRCHVDLRT